MESLFRLTLVRPAINQDENTPSILLEQPSPFQDALKQARQNEKPREPLKTVARQFVASDQFVGDPKKNSSLYNSLKAVSNDFNLLEKKEKVTNGEVAAAVEKAFGKKPDKLKADKVLDAPLASLKDSLLAIKLLPEEHARKVEDLTWQLRDLEVILKLASDANFPGSGKTLRQYRRRSVQLPAASPLTSILSTTDRLKELEQHRKEEEARKQKEAEGKLDLYKRLNAAIEELSTLNSEHLNSTVQKASTGFMVAQEFQAPQLAIAGIVQRKEVSKLDLVRLQSTISKQENIEGVARIKSAEVIIKDIAGNGHISPLIAGKGPFTPVAGVETAFRLKATAEQVITQPTLELLKGKGLNVTINPLDFIVENLRTDVVQLTNELDNLLGRPVQKSLKRVGGTMVLTSMPMASVWNNLVIGGSLVGKLPLPINLSVPTTHGNVAAAGVADLLVVKQQLVRYEAADVAHIENVLKGEKKEREHTMRRETEEFTLRETETTTTEERELESTTRFEMSRESDETIKEDASLKAGLNISGKYGPTVEFSASAEGSVSRSKEEATKVANSFSQDVTERSATKISQRVLERSSLRVTNEVIDKNTHVLDNVAGSGHISGVYQWVNKVYEAQMYNYGIRMMYDFMVPEPAAFLISSLQNAHANAVELEKPAPFTIRPDQITEYNYFTWVKQYAATDVQPPPEIYKTKSIDFKGGGGEEGTNYNHSAQLQIDEGYKAVYGTVASLKNIWDNNATVDVALGTRTHRFPLGDWLWNTNLNEERDSIPFALDTMHVSDVEVIVEVKCQRTERAMIKWQLETHAKITSAYKARLSEYEEKLSALEVQAGVAIQGRNPQLNMEMMKDELKKHCITILTEQHFDLFDSIQTGSYNIPQINLTENAAEGAYVRFFEQAFEWEQMTWLTYPYFWGRKSQWDERIAYEDVDPVFNQFLKAGYCRVVIPVRPGFEGAVDHFTTYGEIWNGGPLPAISNPLYLPIADEIAERLNRPGEEIPQGDPWLVRIPTTLVKLRADDKLPKWKKDNSGEWVEDQ